MVRPILFCVFLCVLPSVPLYGATDMVVALDRSALYEGESLDYQIQLKSDKPLDDAVVPDFSAFSDFHVETRPKQTSSSVLIDGGKMVQEHSVTFTYLLTPHRTGTLKVPTPKIIIDGIVLRPLAVKVGREARPVGDGSIPITVQPQDRQDVVRMEISANKERVYPFQPITVTLTVHVKELPGQYENVNPLALPRDPPLLSIPWIEDKALPKGLQPTQSAEAWLSGLHLRGRQRGFAINGLADRSIGFFGDAFFSEPLGRRSLLQFSPTPTQVQRPDADGKEQTYWEYKFSRSFLPLEIGTLTFGPVNVKGMFAVAYSATEAKGQQLYAIASPISVQVVDVPKDHRPAEYIGAFGSFRWSVELRPRKASVGDPLTLTLSLTGRGSTANVSPPDLAKNSEISKNFKVYPPSEEVRGETCVFTYTVRPTVTGNIVLPSIPIAYFDTETEQFVSLAGEPISIDVVASEALHVASPLAPMFGGELERSPSGLFANMVAPHGVVDQSIDIVRWAWTMASLLIGYGVLAASVLSWRRWNANPVRRRRHGALGRAKRRLAEIRTADINALQNVLIGCVADLTDGIEHGMTPKDVCVRLMDLGVSDQRVAEVRGILETLDGSRFGGLDLRSFDDLAKRMRRLLDEIAV